MWSATLAKIVEDVICIHDEGGFGSPTSFYGSYHQFHGWFCYSVSYFD
ncbi:unnamed protein product [Prunus armeniaca]